MNLRVGRVASTQEMSQQYGLWEWVAALGGAYPRTRGEQFVFTDEHVRAVVGGMGTAFCEYASRIASADTAVTYAAAAEKRASLACYLTRSQISRGVIQRPRFGV